MRVVCIWLFVLLSASSAMGNGQRRWFRHEGAHAEEQSAGRASWLRGNLFNAGRRKLAKFRRLSVDQKLGLFRLRSGWDERSVAVSVLGIQQPRFAGARDGFDHVLELRVIRRGQKPQLNNTKRASVLLGYQRALRRIKINKDVLTIPPGEHAVLPRFECDADFFEAMNNFYLHFEDFVRFPDLMLSYGLRPYAVRYWELFSEQAQALQAEVVEIARRWRDEQSKRKGDLPITRLRQAYNDMAGLAWNGDLKAETPGAPNEILGVLPQLVGIVRCPPL